MLNAEGIAAEDVDQNADANRASGDYSAEFRTFDGLMKWGSLLQTEAHSQ